MKNCVLPEDIIFCILMRLPVKSIVCFKSVCKSWRELFSTPWFVKRQEECMSSGPQTFFIEGKGHVPVILESSTGTINHACPETYSPMGMDFVGCSNGLVCLSHPKTCHVIMWNPALKLFKVLKLLEHVELSSVSVGLGYDDEGDDFKVVRLIYSKIQKWVGEHQIVYGAEVYSANSDSPMTVEVDFRFYVLWDKATSSAVVNGIPYWEANVDSRQALIRFDVKKMLFEIVPVLNLENCLWHCRQYVGWKGSLGAIAYNSQHKSIDVWVFNEGGGRWRKNHTIGTSALGILDFWKLQCSNNGAIIMLYIGKSFVFDPKTSLLEGDDELLVVLDLNTGCYQKVSTPHSYIYNIYPYTESLAYVKGMTQVSF